MPKSAKPKPAKKKLPSARELLGSDPDFTGNMTTDEYIRSLRGYGKSRPPVRKGSEAPEN